jgi:hypothetical protein
MRPLLAALLALAAPALGCGSSIGDSCSTSADCSTDGDRICDYSSPGGYCTVESCDYGTCPDDAVCVRFFPGIDLSAPSCTPATGEGCSLSEVCTLAGVCAPRSIERRYCMATCSGDGDCRGGYECRDQARMLLHGGEPVPSSSGAMPGDSFCAPLRPCLSTEDCDTAIGETCNSDLYCELP